jgi:hypothetical protein
MLLQIQQQCMITGTLLYNMEISHIFAFIPKIDVETHLNGHYRLTREYIESHIEILYVQAL